MKTNIKLLLKVVLACVPQLLVAAGAVSEVSQQLLRAGAKAVQSTMDKARVEAGALQRSIDEEMLALDHKREALKQEEHAAIKHRKIALRHDGIKTSLALAQDTYIQAEKLRRNTVIAIEKIIQQAEQEALKIKAEQRRKIMARFLVASKNNEKKAWKLGLRAEFLEHMRALEDIVQQGESEQEYQDFAASFAKQRAWFTGALEAIKSPSDQAYFALFHKVEVLKNMIISFNEVAAMLDQRISEANMVVVDIDKARVLALYDIQVLVADKKQPGGIADEAYLSKRECGLVVDGIFNKLAARHRIDTLMAQKATMQAELLSQQNRVQLLDELANREQQEFALAAARVRNERLQEAQQKALESNARLHNTVLVAIETANKENAELQLKMLEDKSANARLNDSSRINKLTATSTVPQPVPAQLQTAQVASSGKGEVVVVPLSAEMAERQTRVVLEGELQQRMTHG